MLFPRQTRNAHQPTSLQHHLHLRHCLLDIRLQWGATQTFYLNLNGNDVANTEDLGQGMEIRYQFMELEATPEYTVSVFSRNGVGSSALSKAATFTTLDQEVGMR